MRRAIKADQDQLFPVDVIDRIHDVGAITYSYSILGAKNYHTSDEKNIQTILAVAFQDWDLGPVRRGNFWPLLGNGIFTQDGKGWEHSRAMMRPQFAREQVSDLDLEERHVQNLMRALEASIGSDNNTQTVDLSELFFRLTLDSASEFLFGESVDSQITLMPGYSGGKKADKQDVDFANTFDRAQMSLATRARFNNLYWMVSPKGFKEACNSCHAFIDHFVRLALSKDPREKELEKGRGKEKYIFLDALVAETRDPIELRSQLLHILLAGRDTTASHLGWLFMSLSKDPSRYKKLRSIVIDEFGTYDHPKDITFAKLKSCQYLQHCNNESLRLYPVVPINGRFANKDTVLPRGGGKDGKSKIFIPKGTSVDYSVHALHRRKDLWGQDADEFKPERWEGRKVGWEFLPVGFVDVSSPWHSANRCSSMAAPVSALVNNSLSPKPHT
jgi:cytochrome P450